MAHEYHWLPWQTDYMDWADVMLYFGKAKERVDQRANEKITEYITLLNITHTDKPGRLLKQFNEMLKETEKSSGKMDDDIGDLVKLKQLKESRRRVGYGS